MLNSFDDSIFFAKSIWLFCKHSLGALRAITTDIDSLYNKCLPTYTGQFLQPVYILVFKIAKKQNNN